jgi:hypothetical protein
MSKKMKFKPRITRVKLNPEQAVLTCDCYDTGENWSTTSGKSKAETLSYACNPPSGRYEAPEYPCQGGGARNGWLPAASVAHS